MKLVTFEHNGAARLGALVSPEHVLDLNHADAAIPADMIAFLEAGDSALSRARQAVASADATALLDLSSVRLLSPVPRPGKIICIGLNYADHAAESNSPIPDYPVVFCKYANTVIAHGDSIVIPNATADIDYEAELAFVIGRRGRHIPEAEAFDYVAGYMPLNDVSAREYQRRVSQWTMGKTFDTFAPMGPALTTRDEVPDPHNLRIQLRIGEEVLQDSSTNQLIFGIPALIVSLSEVMTLEPGDVVTTGTPPGVGFARKPPRWLRPGDVVHVEIEGLGTLSNPVVAEG